MTYRSRSQVAVHVVLGAGVVVGAWASALYWLSPPVVAVAVAAIATRVIVRLFGHRVRRAVATDEQGITVVNEEDVRRVAWDDVYDVRLVERPGRRPPRAVLRLRDGEEVPLDGIQGTELQTRGHARWRTEAVMALQDELERRRATEAGTR